ncbi:MAG TPA: lipoyl(octanoyl) transferase LipB [bacterium]|nr:lipoyl(octanoyl) transferase LipB [bacterium]
MPDELLILDLGKKDYKETWDLQKELQKKRIDGEINDVLILVEHSPVYTLGKNADDDNLIATEKFLKNQGIEVYNIDRGGDITYHGPGQLVGYPIFNIREMDLGIKDYVYNVEQVLINMLKNYNIDGDRIEKLTGVWIGKEKLAAIGIRVSRWVTMHGFALNVRPDLTKFGGIIPCGITDKGVTRMIDLNPEVKWNHVKNMVIENFQKIFQYNKMEKVTESTF